MATCSRCSSLLPARRGLFGRRPTTTGRRTTLRRRTATLAAAFRGTGESVDRHTSQVLDLLEKLDQLVHQLILVRVAVPSARVSPLSTPVVAGWAAAVVPAVVTRYT